MELEKNIGRDIAYSAKLIEEGEVVAIPTETVYGLAANALDEAAVEKIFRIKNRPLFNPLIVHVASFNHALSFTQQIPVQAIKLMEIFSPGPLTVLLPKNEKIPDIVTAGLPEVAIRVPNHSVTLSLLLKLGLPLAAPSANPFGYISPTSAKHVQKMLGEKVKYILDGGKCMSGIESTILGFPNGVTTIFREGAITKEEIENIVGPVQQHNSNKLNAPGMLPNHYQPNTTLVLCKNIDEGIMRYSHCNIGVITYDSYSMLIEESKQILLCKDGNYNTAAHNLYAAMHAMDESDYDMILVKSFPQSGIGNAINDRLKKASKK